MDRRIGERQRWAWLAGGLSAAVAACACGLGWIWVLAGGLPVAAYYIYMDRKLPSVGLAALLSKRFGVIGRALAVLTLIWTVLAMGWAANLADGAFPMVNGFPVLGWTVLALAAWGSWKGSAACARCAGVLCLFLVFLYGMVTVFAAPDVQWENLRPVGSWQGAVCTAGLFLLPASVWYGPCTRSRKRAAWEMGLLLPLVAAVLAGVTAGVLTPVLAASLPSPLYTLAQSVSLFGVVERIEPLLSAAMVMGVFCLLSGMACACRELAGQIFAWRWSGAICCAIAGALMGILKTVDLFVLTGGCLLFWVVLPLATVWCGRRRRKQTTDSGETQIKTP